MPITDALSGEEEFFKTHPAYKPFAPHMGTQYLARSLNRILVHHIHECLPELRGRVTSLLTQTQQKMLALGDFDADTADRVCMLSCLPASAI